MLMKAGSETLRVQNRALVLATLRQRGPASHTSIAGATGLSSATVSAITSEMESEGTLLRLEQAGASGRGRPRVSFQQNPDSAYIATIRITGDRIEYSLVDYAGTLKDRFESIRADGDNDVANFKQTFVREMYRLVERSNLSPDDIQTISVTSKGLVARGRALLLWSPVFDDQQIDFEALLKPRWKGKISLTNETRFAAQAIAEKNRRAPGIYQGGKVATLSLDHAIGLGIAGEEVPGNITSFAPPFGHMVHSPEGPLCRCGSRGCIEAYAGFYAILRTAFEVPDDTIPAKFVPLEEMEKVAERARAGDRMAQYAFRQAGEVIGIGLSRLHSFLGTMPITVTGPGLRFFDLMSDAIEKNVKSNLQVRFDDMPPITLESDEANLIFYGNVQTSLADLDTTILAAQRSTIAGRSNG